MGSGQKRKVPAEQNEGGNVPAHDKYTDGHAHDGRANGIDIAQVLGSQEQGLGTKTFHEAAIHNTKEQEPKQEQRLVLSKMQEQQLNG